MKIYSYAFPVFYESKLIREIQDCLERKTAAADFINRRFVNLLKDQAELVKSDL